MARQLPVKRLRKAAVLLVWQPLLVRVRGVGVRGEHLEGDVIGAGLVIFVDTAQCGVDIAPRDDRVDQAIAATADKIFLGEAQSRSRLPECGDAG